MVQMHSIALSRVQIQAVFECYAEANGLSSDKLRVAPQVVAPVRAANSRIS